jgi:capsid protein
MSEAPDLRQIVRSQPFFERAIAAVAPSWGLQRMQARVAKHLFEYQAAQSNRLFSPKTWGTPSESSRTARDRKVMMWEARDLVENFADSFTVLGKFSNNCTPTEYSPATGDPDYDAQVADYFHEWCKRCDVTGRHSFRKLIQLAVEMRPVDGDCGFVTRRMRKEVKLDLIPADRIGNPNAVSMGDNEFDGIIVDGIGAPEFYRIFKLTKEGQYTDPEDIAARYFRHYFDPFRADQYRGVSAFHAVIQIARMLKGILDAEMVGVKFASQQAALVFNERASAPTRNLFQPTGQTLPTGAQRQDEYSDMGTIKYMATGDRVEVMPSRPGTAFQGFVDHLDECIARGLDIPYGVLFGTAGYKGPNVRAEFAQADRVWARHQGILADKVLDPTKDDVILNAIAEGELPMPKAKEGETVVQALRRACRGEWRWPAKMTIDAGRESTANLNEHRQGILSGQQIAAQQGYDYFATLEQKAQAAAKIKALSEQYGVPETAIELLTSSLPSTPAAAAAAGENVAAAAAAAQADSVPQAGPTQASSELKDILKAFSATKEPTK